MSGCSPPIAHSVAEGSPYRGLASMARTLQEPFPCLRRHLLRHVLGDCPHETRQLPGDRHDCHLRGLGAAGQSPERAVQPRLRLLRDPHHFCGAAFASLTEFVAYPGAMPGAPGRFHQDTAKVRVPHLRDAAAADRPARAALRADRAGVTHERPRPVEAAEFLRFHRDGDGTQRVDPLEAPQVLDRDPVGYLLRQVRDLLVQGRQARFDLLQRLQVRLEGVLQGWPLEALRAEPGLMGHPPRLRLPIDAPLPQEEFRQSVPGPQSIRHDVLPDADHVAGRFLGPGRDSDGRQFPRPIETREFLSVPAVGPAR